MFRKVVREFAEAEIAPHAAQWDHDHHFPVDVVRAMGELGLFGLVFPEEWGGGGGDFASLCVAIEELGRVDQSMGITLSAGRRAGRQPDLPVRQRRAEGAVAARPGRRPGARRLRPHRARRRQRRRRHPHPGPPRRRRWVIDGSKAFITNCGTPITSLITVTARTDDGISAFVVPAGTPGLDRRARRTTSSAGTPATPTASRSTTAACPATTCSASPARASATSSPSSTTAGSRSRRWRSAAPGRASSTRSSTPSSATRSAARSAASRASPSSCPTSPWRSRTPATSPTRRRG